MMPTNRSPESIARRNVACRELRAWYKSRGICIQCGSVWALPGHVRCKACFDRDKATHKRSDPDGAHNRELKQILRDKRLANRQCLNCGAALEDGYIYKYCPRCRGKRAEANHRYQIRQRMKKELEMERARANGS